MNDTIEPREIMGGIENVPGLKHHDIKVCGGPMSIYEAGIKGKPAVVMLHGAMYDEARFIWDQMFPFLSRYYHVFALDIPRHGKSRPWEGNMDHLRLMDILHNTFSQLELEQFSLVGLSMGGGLSIEYGSLYPDEVRSMVLFEPGGLGAIVDLEFLCQNFFLIFIWYNYRDQNNHSASHQVDPRHGSIQYEGYKDCEDWE